MSKIIVIGVAGGSGSGKTTFASRLKELLGDQHCSVIAQDSYYIDQSHKFDRDGGAVNFDHPNSLDFTLMCEHIKLLRQGQDIEVPQYDFATHTRSKDTIYHSPTKIIFVDGILIFSQQNITDVLHYKIYIDCPEELRYERRLNRDVKERGRTPEGVEAQFRAQVKPMHDQFVEPSKEHACDVVTVEDFEEKLEHWKEYLINKYLNL